jgi:hypothetical protein
MMTGNRANSLGSLDRLERNLEHLCTYAEALQQQNQQLESETILLREQLLKSQHDLQITQSELLRLRSHQAEREDVFAPKLLAHDDQLYIRRRLEQLLEQINFELQRLD